MLEKAFKLIIIIIICLLLFIVIQNFRKIYTEKSIINQLSKKSESYNISNNIIRITEQGYTQSYPEEIQDHFKMVHEINFDCFICLEGLKEIYIFYTELSKIRKIEFCLITTEKSYGYIKSRIDDSLYNYDLFVIQQEFKDDNINLYLLDNLNKIVIAGDIKKYPFLKNEYRKKLNQ